MERILIIEDEKSILLALEDNLKLEGYEISSALDGEQGLSMARAQNYDLIILDIMLPIKDGFEVCKTIKSTARFAQIPVILMSARGRGDDRERSFDLGATEFLTKPCPFAELVRRVREILASP